MSGIGFLGAGAILFRKEIAQGLNMASSIWVVAAIELACGSGLRLEAGIVTLLTVGVQAVLRLAHRHFQKRTRHKRPRFLVSLRFSGKLA